MSEAGASWEDRFVSALEGLRDRKDRGALAELRRCLNSEVPYAIYRWLPAGLKSWQERAALEVAPLFALHPDKGGHGNFGASLAGIKDPSDSLEKRFVGLLDSHRDDLPEHLRHLVTLLRSKSVPVEWRQLLKDVQGWDHESRYVQKQWAKLFWTKRSADQPEEGAADEAGAP
jgi:CRISPR system Cascade subunit CasB